MRAGGALRRKGSPLLELNQGTNERRGTGKNGGGPNENGARRQGARIHQGRIDRAVRIHKGGLIGDPACLLWYSSRTGSRSLANGVASLIGDKGGLTYLLINSLGTRCVGTGGQGNATAHGSDDGTNGSDGANDTRLKDSRLIICLVERGVLLALNHVTCIHGRAVVSDFFFCGRNTNPWRI